MNNSTSGALGTVTHCPVCAATVRLGAPWCTLCYADLRPVPEPQPDPTLELALRFDPLMTPAEALGLPGRHAAPAAQTTGPPGAASWWPCTACDAKNALTESVCSACGTGFLAGVREEEGPLLAVPGVGDLTALSRVQRLGLAAAVVVLVSALTALLAVLTG